MSEPQPGLFPSRFAHKRNLLDLFLWIFYWYFSFIKWWVHNMDAHQIDISVTTVLWNSHHNHNHHLASLMIFAPFTGLFSRLAFRTLPSFPKPSPARQRQLRGPGFLREPGSPGRTPPAGWPQHAPAGPQIHRQLCRLLLSLAALQWAQLWDQPLSSLTRFLGLRGEAGGGRGGGREGEGGEDGWMKRGR